MIRGATTPRPRGLVGRGCGNDLHSPHQDDTRLRGALGAAYRPASPVDGAYLARFTSALTAPAARAGP
jgi:hypothetical protein